MTTTIHEPDTLFSGLSARQRQCFKNSIRHEFALQAGANPSQLAALKALEKGFNAHFPSYSPNPEGTLEVTYQGVTDTSVTATVHTDGTLRVRA
jgi:hypothetical protein